MNKSHQFFVTIICSILFGSAAMAQAKYEDARNYLDKKNYEKAASIYKELYAQMPEKDEVYQEYLYTLMALKDFKKAENIAMQQLKRHSNRALFYVDLGGVYAADNKSKKAAEQFEEAIKYINGDDVLTQQMANKFANAERYDWAIKSYERAMQITQIPGLYNAALAKLYNKTGDVEKAISLVVEGHQGLMQMNGDETTEATLLEIMGTDADKQKKAQKAIIKLVNAQPDNYYYTYLLTWIFAVQNNWEQALVQIVALDKRSQDKGRLLVDFAAKALAADAFDVAQKAYNNVIAYGQGSAWYRPASEGVLKLQLTKVQNSAIAVPSQIEITTKNFADFFTIYPDAIHQPIIQDYALLLVQYAHQTDQGIALLKQAITNNIGNKILLANCKLQLGDYYIIQGKVWDAALMYAQVDKAFREDALGEEARFRNAKLSYYQNDFEQAQGQLSVLKASTSELIANDALYLSVLITENVPPDSNLVPLQRFAFADLLLFQNKDQEAEKLLDSIATAFAKNPLADDILLMRSKIAIKHKDYSKAIGYLKTIVEQHGKDVLADDALYQIAEIYKTKLSNTTEARKYYEQLIIDYPGSSFVPKVRDILGKMPLI